ncbi:MAG TPA: hypothetical protein VGM06_17995 [Polyangiaceae bacterium]
MAKACRDGDLACYAASLVDPDREVVRTALALMVRTTPEDHLAAAREVLVQRLRYSEEDLRPDIGRALEALSPHGCPECMAQLTQQRHDERREDALVALIQHLQARQAASSP